MVTYEQPRRNLKKEDCIFYHVCDLPDVGTVGTEWDLRQNIDAYLGRLDYSGKSVLDVGAATGFLSFEMEKRGAQVTSFEMASPAQYQFVPYWQDRPQRAEQLERWAGVLEKVKNGYWFSHERLRSRARVYYGDVYDLPESLGQFDVVMVGMILPHLRDPCRALESASLRSRDTVVVSQGFFSDPRPVISLIPEALPTEHSRIAWWAISDTAIKTFMAILGFDLVRVETAPQKCVAFDPPQDMACSAFVFRRRG